MMVIVSFSIYFFWVLKYWCSIAPCAWNWNPLLSPFEDKFNTTSFHSIYPITIGFQTVAVSKLSLMEKSCMFLQTLSKIILHVPQALSLYIIYTYRIIYMLYTFFILHRYEFHNNIATNPVFAKLCSEEKYAEIWNEKIAIHLALNKVDG